MGTDNYYELTALPVLDPPGAAPPLTLAEFLERVPPGRALQLARTVVLADDLQLREALRAGEVGEAAPAVLTPEQARGEAPLPPELAPAEGASHALPADATWEAYYRSAAELAKRLHSGFLERWVATEVRLRNELARERARALGLQPGAYQVARWLESSGAEVEAAVRAWLDAPDPLAGLRALIAARWRWLEQQEPLFTFETDEFPVYAARLALLHRWQRSAAEPPIRNWAGGMAT